MSSGRSKLVRSGTHLFPCHVVRYDDAPTHLEVLQPARVREAFDVEEVLVQAVFVHVDVLAVQVVPLDLVDVAPFVFPRDLGHLLREYRPGSVGEGRLRPSQDV